MTTTVTSTTNPPKPAPQHWKAYFTGTNVTDYLIAVPFNDERLTMTFPPFPVTDEPLSFSRPLDRINDEFYGETIASRANEIPGLVVKSIAFTPSGARFFVKMTIHLEEGPDSLHYFIAQEILAETRFYANHLRDVAHVPRHYGIFTARTSWGGRIMCQIMECFDGSPWTLFQSVSGASSLRNRYVMAIGTHLSPMLIFIGCV